MGEKLKLTQMSKEQWWNIDELIEQDDNKKPPFKMYIARIGYEIRCYKQWTQRRYQNKRHGISLAVGKLKKYIWGNTKKIKQCSNGVDSRFHY